jgi:phage/plasmid-associated DNA primase
MEAVKQYRNDEDLIGDFLNEHVVDASGEETAKSEMFERYRDWAQREGIRYLLSSKGLERKLRDRGFIARRATGGRRVWSGVALTK